MGKKQKPPEIEDYVTLAEAARRAGLPKQTLHSAVARGDVPVRRVQDGAEGFPLLLMDDVWEWVRGPRLMGRPPKSRKAS
jgi:hypothetical protein